MGSGKPLISILMAVYEPRMDWLEEQLKSLNEQTYPNLQLYVRDDCSLEVPFEKIEGLVKRCITAFPYFVERNEENLGSNKTFERLTMEAEGKIFAYCDQDDIWMPEKLEILEQAMIQNTVLAYSDMSVIGEAGETIAESLREVRPRLQYQSGNGLSEYYLFQNCTAGCSMILRAEIARWAYPFPSKTVCDQWLCMIGASCGEIAFIQEKLLSYRQHENNQTGILSGVTDKESYRRCRIEPLVERAEMFERYAPLSLEAVEYIKGRREEKKRLIWKHRRLCPKDSWMELVMDFFPPGLFSLLIKRARGG